MDARPDTSSGRSHDGLSWSFLHLNHPSVPSTQDAQALRSRPPSSYLVGSDRSITSPLPHGRPTYNASRSSRSFSRNIPSASTGARSTTTLPSQPVLSIIDSSLAYNHNNQFVRRNRREIMPDPVTGLPAVKEFSIAGILAAIHEDIEGDVNTIAEILGRHRFAPADEYDAQMPPQGEIVGQESLVDDDAGPSHVGDNVMILNEDASLVEGSNAGSAAYGLLERLQAHPRPARMTSDAPIVTRPARNDAAVPEPTRTLSSPAVLQPPESQLATAEAAVRPHKPVKRRQRHRSSLPARGPAGPVVSETWLSAEAVGVSSGMVPTVSEAGRHYPLYTHEDTGLFEATAFDRDTTPHGHRFLHWTVPTFSSFTSWFSGRRHNSDQGAEARLRSLLAR